MPRRARVDSCVVAFIGRPTLALVPAPASATGVEAAVASASKRENSRSSTGSMFASTAHSSRSFLSGLAAIERKHLGRVQQPLWIEHRLDPHLHGEVGLGELHPHQIALLNA